MSRPVKVSVTLSGHRTSISLEPEFLAIAKVLAAMDGLSFNALVASLEPADRSAQGLSTAIRLFVLRRVARREWVDTIRLSVAGRREMAMDQA